MDTRTFEKSQETADATKVVASFTVLGPDGYGEDWMETVTVEAFNDLLSEPGIVNVRIVGIIVN